MVWMATVPFVLAICVGIAVDLTGKVHTQQHARNVAAQAARAGAQEIQASASVRGEPPRSSLIAAKAAAARYLQEAGVKGSVRLVGRDTIVVSTTETYSTRALGIIGMDSMRVTGEGSARVVRTVDGEER